MVKKQICDFLVWAKYRVISCLAFFATVSLIWNVYVEDKNNVDTTRFIAYGMTDFQPLTREIEKARVLNLFRDVFEVFNGKMVKLENEFGKFNVDISEQVERIRNDFFQLRNNILQSDVFSQGTYWWKAELMNLTNLIQNRIFKLQHPTDCKKAKKLFCAYDNPNCGFGCQIHSISYCLIVAYSKKRVLLPVFDKWSYSTKGWNEYFAPLTNCTLNDKSDEPEYKTVGDDSMEILTVPFYNYPLPTLPPAFPKEFAETLINVHPNPPVFWIGQFMAYIIRYNLPLQEYLEERVDALNFSSPIVGIHVRRTDKHSEAEFFHINEYMKQVSAWYDMNSGRNAIGNEKRQVYLATDEPSVIDELLLNYPNYTFLFDYAATVNAKFNRYTDSSLLEVLTSLHMLINCDFVVCTFSSNICRFVYELKQILNITTNVLSLDTIYYYYGQQSRHQVAIHKHRPEVLESDEIELNIGDILEVKLPALSKYENKKIEIGLTEGRNLRTNKSGKYPTYKVKEKWLITDFSKYP